MDKLVDIVNQLQDVFAVSGSAGIDLPQIVVVGAQSSGKSSVLEHIVGKSFLPRGVGIVTRCPLILQLIHAPGEAEEYAIFQQDNSKRIKDFSQLTKEIDAETDRLAGANKGICHTPISLKIFSPSFLNLTLVDLPGLTKVPVGDQPWDIEDQTRDLIMKYIESKNSIILAVTPANVDMATSEALKLAKEVDAEGKRTVAVITKLDLMDQGTDAWDMLNGNVIPVKLGIIGVVNRSQKDIQDDKSIAQSLIDETEFFKTHYTSIANRNGCNYLKKIIQTILVGHIKNCFPELREKIKDKLRNLNNEMFLIKESNMDKKTLFLDLITKFTNAYISAINGKLIDVHTEELYGGAKIKCAFQKSLSTDLNHVDALFGLTKSYIMTAMENSSGIKSPIFVPEIAFESLVKKQIEQLRAPSNDCVGLVHKELGKIIQLCIEDPDSGLELYPKMINGIDKVVTDLLQERVPITHEMVNHFIDVQLAHINTVHPDFFPNNEKNLQLLNKLHINKNINSVSSKVNQKVSQKLQSTDETEDEYEDEEDYEDEDEEDLLKNTHEKKINRDYRLIRKLIRSYFNMVRKTVEDMVPKITMHFLVNYVMKNINTELIKFMLESNPDDVLQELDDVTERRKDLKRDIKALEQATQIINKISSLTSIRCKP